MNALSFFASCGQVDMYQTEELVYTFGKGDESGIKECFEHLYSLKKGSFERLLKVGEKRKIGKLSQSAREKAKDENATFVIVTPAKLFYEEFIFPEERAEERMWMMETQKRDFEEMFGEDFFQSLMKLSEGESMTKTSVGIYGKTFTVSFSKESSNEAV